MADLNDIAVFVRVAQFESFSLRGSWILEAGIGRPGAARPSSTGSALGSPTNGLQTSAGRGNDRGGAKGVP